MSWLVCALLTALFESLKDVASKQGLKVLDEYVVASLSMGLAAIALLPVVLFLGIPELKPGFWWAGLFGGSLNIVAFTLYVRAIKIADLSLTVPLVTLTPLFMLVTSPLILGEYPSFADAIGVILLIVGSYMLNLKERSKGYLVPLKKLWQNQGSRLMLIVAFLWSFTANIDKVGVLNSSPLMWAMFLFFVVALGILPMVLWRSRPSLTELQPHLKVIVLAGGFNALAVGFQMVAVALVPVTQVIAIKRLSALLGVVFGHLIFHETGLRERLAGAAVMVLGVIIINLA